MNQWCAVFFSLMPLGPAPIFFETAKGASHSVEPGSSALNGKAIIVNRQAPRFGRFIGFGADQKTVVTAGRENEQETVAVWSIFDKAEKWSIRGKTKLTDDTSFGISPDGKMLVKCAYLASGMVGVPSIGTLEIWNTADGKKLFSQASKREHYRRIIFGIKPGTFAVLDFDSIGFWTYEPDLTIKQGNFTRDKFTRHPRDLTPDLKRLVHEISFREIEVWDLEAGKSVCILKGHDGISSFSFSPCGKWIASRNLGIVTIWDANNGEPLRKLDASAIAGFVFSPDSKWLATGIRDEVVLWKMPTGERMLSLKCKEGSVGALAFSPKGDMLAATSQGSWYVWALSSPRSDTKRGPGK
jgi:WD40 repeat protein